MFLDEECPGQIADETTVPNATTVDPNVLYTVEKYVHLLYMRRKHVGSEKQPKIQLIEQKE